LAFPTPHQTGLSDASTNGDGTLGFTYASGACSVTSGGLITITGAGPCVVTVSATGGTNYADATPASFTLTVNQAAQVITINNESLTFGSASTYQISPSDASTNGDGTLGFTYASAACSVTSGGLITTAGAGPCVVTVSATGGTNYADATPASFTLTVNQAAQVITINNESLTFGSASTYQISPSDASTNGDGTLGFTYASGACSVTSGGLITITGAGPCVVTVSATGGTNYADATPASFTLTVNQAAQVITINNESLTFGSASTYQISPRDASPTGDGTLGFTYASGACSVTSGGLITITGAGPCVVTVSATGGAKYAAATPASLTLTVEPAAQGFTIYNETLTFGSASTYQISPSDASTNGDGTLGFTYASGACSVT